jgi:spore germination protein
MREKGYRGLDVDFEYVDPDKRLDYALFIERLTRVMNDNGYEVTVALAPKTYAQQPGLLYEAHDDRALGKSANRLLLMTYEWGYTYGPPQAVAPIGKVEEVVNYALTEIPREKLLMGIPNYGYDWTLPYVPGSAARSLSTEEAVFLARRYGADILFDERAASPYFYYTDDAGAEHVVWFEDARSFGAKLSLIRRKGLTGYGVWTVMRPAAVAQGRRLSRLP